MNELERSLSNIENIIVDPDFAAMLKTAEKLNELLYFDPQTADDAQRRVDTLNKLWRENGFHGKEVFVTGVIHAGSSYESPLYTPLTDSTRFQAQRVLSQGFILHYAINEDAMGASEHPLLMQKILMKGRTLIEDPTGIEGKADVMCVFDTTRSTVEYREMTPRRSEAWLAEYYPDVKDDLDVALLNAASECEAVMNLANLTVDIQKMKHKKIEKLVQHMHQMLLGQVKFDKHFAYSVMVEGEITVFDPINLRRNEVVVNDILYVHAREVSVWVDEETETLKTGLAAEIIDNGQDVARPAHIPVDVIEAIESHSPWSD